MFKKKQEKQNIVPMVKQEIENSAIEEPEEIEETESNAEDDITEEQVKSALMQHEARISNLESTIFRLKNI